VCQHRAALDLCQSLGGIDVTEHTGAGTSFKEKTEENRPLHNGSDAEPANGKAEWKAEPFAMIPLSAATSPHLSMTARVLIYLANQSKDPWGVERRVRASLNEIAEGTHSARHNVSRAIKKLESEGRLRKLPRQDEQHGHDKTEYVLVAVRARARGASLKSETRETSLDSETNLASKLRARQNTEEERLFCFPKKENSGVASMDPVKKALFDAGLALLVGHGGLPADRARNILGRWRKLVGHKDDLLLLSWIRDALHNAVPDPVAYLEAVIKDQAKRSQFGAGYRPMPSAAGG
jgi:DNA-binding MarR family transcriptional regulator